MTNVFLEINFLELLLNLILATSVSVLTAYLTLKHFYKKEIWLRKEKIYSQIINDLVVLLDYFNKEYDSVLSFNKVGEDEFNIRKEYDRAKREIEKLRYTAGYLIKPEVNKLLSKMIKEISNMNIEERQGNYVGYLDRASESVDETIKKIIEIADKDLN
ncbi:MAG: hypothetical protein H0S78_00435 [Tissierellales bacterium]|jgi:hypothetical protein|nr:hypothetical protein [Tissierellales bacterium]